MIVETTFAMPYAFSVRAEVKKGRTTKTRNFADVGVVEAAVKEVSDKDAPVVLSWIASPFFAEIPEVDPQAVPHEIRYFNGSFYVPPLSLSFGYLNNYHCKNFPKGDLPIGLFYRSNFGGRLITLTIERSECGYNASELAALSTVFRSGAFSPSIGHEVIVERQILNQHLQRAAALKVLSDALIIDGDIWMRVEEPRFMLRRLRNGGYHAEVHVGQASYRAGLTNEPHNVVGSPHSTRFFSINDRDGFEAGMADWGVTYRDVNRSIGRMKIHEPTLFVTDWEANGMERLAEHAVTCFGPHIGDQCDDTVRTWLDVRDALHVYRGHADRGALETAISVSIPRLLAGFDGHHSAEMEEITACLEELYPASLAGQSAAPQRSVL